MEATGNLRTVDPFAFVCGCGRLALLGQADKPVGVDKSVGGDKSVGVDKLAGVGRLGV